MHPRYLLEKPWQERQLILSETLVDYTGPRLEAVYSLATWLWSFPLLGLGLPLLLAYGLIAWRSGTTAAPLVFAATALAGGLLAYHADAMEVPRHCITTVFGLRCALLHVALLVLDRWVTYSSARLRPR